jgi:hypothetical protein
MKNWNWLKNRKKKKEDDSLVFPMDFKTAKNSMSSALWSKDVLDEKSMEKLFKYMLENKDIAKPTTGSVNKPFIIDSYSSITGSVKYDAKEVARSKKWAAASWSKMIPPIINSMNITGSVPSLFKDFERFETKPNPNITTMIPPVNKNISAEEAATFAAFPHLASEKARENIATSLFSVYIGNPNNQLRSFIWNDRKGKIYLKDNRDIVQGALDVMNARMIAESTPHEPMLRVTVEDEKTNITATYVLHFKDLYLRNDEICVKFCFVDVSQKGNAMNILSKIGMNCIFYIMGAIETNDDQTEIEMMEIDHIAYLSGRKLVEKILKPIVP